MKTKLYYVIDEENNTVWHGRDDDDKPMEFKNFADAEKRAKEIAEATPGSGIKIVGVEAVVRAEVSPPKTSRVDG